jgi:hypothetical protein
MIGKNTTHQLTVIIDNSFNIKRITKINPHGLKNKYSNLVA